LSQALNVTRYHQPSPDRSGFRVIHAQEGQTLAYRGGRADSLYLIQSGSVEIWQGSELEENSLERRVLGPGSFVGELGFGVNEVADYTIRALENTELLRFDTEGVGSRLRDSLGESAGRLRKLLGLGEELFFVA